MLFASSSADIIIGGSAAGVGKTFSLLLEVLRYITRIKGFGCVIFRRTTPQIRNEGGLWDKSRELFGRIKNARPKSTVLEWIFRNPKDRSFQNKVKFAHLQHEDTKDDWQGSEIAYIGFDELTHFTKTQFFYLLTRNRSTCGVKPIVRATCNPDPWSWVRDFLVSGGYVDDITGFPIPEMEGIIRYFILDGNGYIWGDSYEEVYEAGIHILKPLIEATGYPKETFIKSFTFIAGSIYDNKALLSVNPEYLGNLVNQDEQTVNQLLKANWNIKATDKDIYNPFKFKAAFENHRIPRGTKRICSDIAFQGSNKFVIMYFEGRRLEDIEIIAKSTGPEVIQAIITMRDKHGVDNENIIYDADGVGMALAGFIPGAIAFKARDPVIEIRQEDGNLIKENYAYLKDQLFYRSGNAVNADLYYISPEVANKMYDDTMTVKQRFRLELKCAQKFGIDKDGKLKILPKDKMKELLPSGESPDVIETFAMNEYFEVNPERDFSVYA